MRIKKKKIFNNVICKNHMIRDRTFMMQIEKRNSAILKEVYKGTIEELDFEETEILERIITILDKNPLLLSQIKLEYEFKYDVQVKREKLYAAFGYGILTRKIIPISLTEFPSIRNRYFVSMNSYLLLLTNKDKIRKKEKMEKVTKRKTVKRKTTKKKTEKIHIKPKSFREMIGEKNE